MKKIIVTKNRNSTAYKTEFLAKNGDWISIGNKNEFQSVKHMIEWKGVDIENIVDILEENSTKDERKNSILFEVEMDYKRFNKNFKKVIDL